MVYCWNIVSELIKLGDCIMDWMEIKMSSYIIRINIVGRMLNRTEIINIICSWNNNHSSGMLPCSSFYTCASYCKALFFSLVHYNSALLSIFFNKTKRSFFSNCRYCARFENVILSKQFFCITMRFWLIFTTEVKVNIRHFITLKSKKSFKRYFVTVLIHFCTAFGTILWRHIKAGTVTSVCNKLTVFALWTNIMRTQRINLWNTRHCGNKRRTYRTSWTNKISMGFTVCNKLLCSHIENGESVGRNGIEFLVKTSLNNFRKRVAIFIFCPFPCNIN